MTDYEKKLGEALAENAQFKSDQADALRSQSTAVFRNKLKLAERIMWVYLLACVLIGVPVYNLFESSTDLKTLISCLLGLVVIYETTVLLKLWFMIAGTKISLLKEIKQLRLEVSQLASAAGVTSPSDVLSSKYDPIQGASKMERKSWLVGLVVAAFLASSLSSGEYGELLGSSDKLTVDSLVTLAADGSATGVTKIAQLRSSEASEADFSFYAPTSSTVRWVDSEGHKMPFRTSPHNTHTHYEVQLPSADNEGGRVIYAYTRLDEAPGAASQADDVWTYTSDMEYGLGQNDFTTTVLLPEGIELVSAEPKPALEFTSNGRHAYRFQGTRGQNEKFEFQLQYRFVEKPSASE